jgi:uncharacterized protein (TIGR02231 family)
MASDVKTESIALPITQVTCLEDRAQVERRGELTLAKGEQQLRIAPVSPVAVDRSLKVELSGAALVDARVVRRWKEKPRGGLAPDASALRRRVHEHEQAAALAAADTSRKTARLELIRGARAALLRSISEWTGAGKTNLEGWRDQLERLAGQEAAAEEEVRRLQAEHRRINDRLDEARRALAVNEKPEEELEASLLLVVDSASGGACAARISYLVPCAIWRPAYRATLLQGAEGAESVHLESEAVIWQRTGEDWREAHLVLSTARPTLGASPPILVDDRLSLRDKSEAEKRSVEVSIREEVIQTTGERAGAATTEMPGIDDGGQVQLLSVPGKASVPSDGQPHRVFLSAFDAPAKTELLCAPELSPLVSLVARFENRGKHVLLAGPVDLIRHSGFVGRAQLKFAAIGEGVKLAFGSEDHLRVGRDVLSEQDENRLTRRRKIHRTVKLFVSNAGGAPARLALEERILVSEVKEVEISLLPRECSPVPSGPSKDGILRFELQLPARSQQEVKLAYEISAAAKVEGL